MHAEQWARHITRSCQSRPPKLAFAVSSAFDEGFDLSLVTFGEQRINLHLRHLADEFEVFQSTPQHQH